MTTDEHIIQLERELATALQERDAARANSNSQTVDVLETLLANTKAQLAELQARDKELGGRSHEILHSQHP